jgi:hypothetical protein
VLHGDIQIAAAASSEEALKEVNPERRQSTSRGRLTVTRLWVSKTRCGDPSLRDSASTKQPLDSPGLTLSPSLLAPLAAPNC